MPLTAKQEKFAQFVASGLTQSDSYRQVYDQHPDSLPDSTWSNASQLAHNPQVMSRIEELRTAIQAAALAELAWDKARLVREAVVNLHGSREHKQYGSANGALEIIGRATGILSDKPRDQPPVQITRVVVMLNDGRTQPVPELPGGIIVDIHDDEKGLEVTGGDDDNRNEEG